MISLCCSRFHRNPHPIRSFFLAGESRVSVFRYPLHYRKHRLTDVSWKARKKGLASKKIARKACPRSSHYSYSHECVYVYVILRRGNDIDVPLVVNQPVLLSPESHFHIVIHYIRFCLARLFWTILFAREIERKKKKNLIGREIRIDRVCFVDCRKLIMMARIIFCQDI